MPNQNQSVRRAGKQYSSQKVQGKRGVIYVEGVCNDTKPAAIFRELQSYDDIGIDAEIEILDQDMTTKGAIAFAQIKSEQDPSKKNGAYSFTADTCSYISWARYPFPIIGIVYSENQERAMWVDISEYIREHRTILDAHTKTVTIEAGLPFDLEHFHHFRNHILERYRLMLLDQAVEEYYTLDHWGRVAYLNVLFARFGDSLLFSCFLERVFWESVGSIEEISILATCLKCMSYYYSEAPRAELRIAVFDLFSRLTSTAVLAILSARITITSKSEYWDDPYFEATELINEAIERMSDVEEILGEISADEEANPWARLRAGQFLQLDPEEVDFREVIITELETMSALYEQPSGLATRVAHLVLSITGDEARASEFLREILEDADTHVDARTNAAGALYELAEMLGKELHYDPYNVLYEVEMWKEGLRLINKDD
jgi:hypothetical protein